MCGRYTLVTDETDIKEHYHQPLLHAYRGPSYNVAPSQFAPVVTIEGIESMRWGLVPQWAKSLNTGYSMINAKAETITEKRTYHQALIHGRCLVPASGFYEWHATSAGKQPYYFQVANSELFSLAGLYVSRVDPEGVELKSFTIITTAANELVGSIHDRMPVILAPEEEVDWLNTDFTDPADILPLLDPFPASAMSVYSVSTKVNSARHQGPDLIQAITLPQPPDTSL